MKNFTTFQHAIALPIFTQRWLLPVLLSALLFLGRNKSNAQTISTYAGGIGEDSSATAYGRLNWPYAVAVDAAGNIYVVDGLVRKVNATTGIITSVGTVSQINYITIDGAGNIYIDGSYQVYKMDVFGNITVIAGTGSCCGGFSGDGSIATAAQLNDAAGLAVDGIGNIYIADRGNGRIRKVDTTGIITTIAGGGGTLGDGGAAISAQLSNPTGVCVDGAGNIYIADNGNDRIRKVNTLGTISTFAGNGSGGYSGDGLAAASARISNPNDVKFDGSGNLYISDNGNSRIRKVNTAGTISTIAGGGSTLGDGGPATAASFSTSGITLDGAGNLYIADVANHRVRKVNTSGIITTVAGNSVPLSGYAGDGGNSLLAEFSNMGDLAADRMGNLYMIDNSYGFIRKINATHVVTTIAGNGIVGYSGDGGPATAAELDVPRGICTDRSGNVYIADAGSAHMRKITGSTITTIAGGGSGGLGDGGPATAAIITANDVAVDSAGNVYIADGGHSRVRKINGITGIITTLAGTGVSGYSGDNGPATIAKLNIPSFIAVDAKNNVYVTDGGNGVIRKIDTGGIITTAAGSGGCCGSIGDGGPASLARLNQPYGITIDKFGNLYIADNSNGIIREVDTFGIIHTVAGNGGSQSGYWRDGVTATATSLANPAGISIDTAGNLFISTYEYPNSGSTNTSIRKVCCLGNIIDYPPLFTHGAAQGISRCASGAITIDTLLRISDADAGQHEKWTVSTAPSHGTIAGLPDSAISTGAIITPSGITYTPSSGFSGTDQFTIQISDGIDYTFTTITVTVNPSASGGTISGPGSVCAGATITLTDGITGGTWSSSNSHATVSGGVVTAVSAGVDTIRYTATNSCGTATTSRTITINPLPTAGIITGPSAVCTSSSMMLSDAVTGGVWSTPDFFILVNSIGEVIGLAPGVGTIRYTVTTGCGTVTATTSVIVSPGPSAGTITGSTTMCAGNTDTLSDLVTGGAWSTATPGVVTISGAGVVTGLAGGAAVIFYTATNGCGTAVTSIIVNVTAAAPISYITGPGAVCAGSTIPLSDAAPGGTWSSADPAIATISPTGVVTGVSAGVTTISYAASLGCGVSVATAAITVNTAATAGTISGTATICTGGTALLTSYAPGGVWSSSNGHATISPAGVLTGVSPGTDTIVYTVSNSCGSDFTTHVVTVYLSPAAGSVTGASSVCAGGSATLSDAATGGVWSSSNTLIASINVSGLVSGIAVGTAILSYTVTTGCGIATATMPVTVNTTTAGIITGVTTLCAGGTSTLSDAITGGAWSSSATAVATISSSGVVVALAGGSTLISYTVAGTCGTATTTTPFSVGSLPTVAPITGTTTMCHDSTTLLGDGTLGGVWSSSSTSVATINSSGLVTGVSAGTSIISYLVTGGCGTGGATAIVHLESMPSPGVISGSTAVCEGAMTTLSESVPGGDWNSSNMTIAVVSASGSVTGVSAGAVIISYGITNSCGAATATFHDTVNTAPGAGFITGVTNICEGAVTTLVDTTGGGSGIWSSGTSAIAVVSGGGVVTGIAAGSEVILYTVSNICGSNSASAMVNVDPLPFIEAITGTTTVGFGGTTTLYDAVAGGTWTTADPAIATINAVGTVTAVSVGTTTMTYTMINGFGCTADTSVSIAVVAVSGIENINVNSGYTLYPNPATNEITIAWENQIAPTAEVIITDIVGKEVLRGNINLAHASGNTMLGLPEGLEGTYIITVKSTGGYYCGKLLILKND